MVAISSVGSQSLIAQQQTAASQAATSAASTPVAPVASTASASPSTVVTLGQSSVSPTYSAVQTAPTPVWESAPNDLVSLRMAGNMSASKLSGRFGGLGATLLDQVRDGGSSFSQAVIQLAPGTSVDTVSATDFHTQAANEIKLTITTRGGATVGITLGSDGDRLAVKLSVSDGELSDTERAAIGKLAQSFQQSIDALSEVPPRLDISGLTQYDSTALASVKLQASVAVGNNQVQTVEFQADDQQRSVTSTGPTGTLKLSVDMANAAIFGTPAQQAKAVSKYLQQFDDARSRGQGDAALMSMFKDAFSALHSHYNTATTQQSRFTLSKGDHGMLTGLADFSASVTQTPTSSNPLRTDEVDSFAYKVSQDTQLQGRSQADRAVTQQQQSSLDASFHRALSADAKLSLTESKYSQSYYYDQIHDSASSQSQFAYRKGKLVSATLTQSAQQSQRTQKYVIGELESDTTTPTSRTRTVDVLALVKAAEKDSRDGLRGNQQVQENVLAGMEDKVMLEPHTSALLG
nr:hypothetical protein [uncultured Cupriavidus sp.]